jgi:peptide/nickel transport system substrate-binding protein
MKRLPTGLVAAAVLAAVLGAVAAPARAAGKYIEVPFLAKRVKAGKLPPIEKRLPETPSVVDFKGTYKKPGRYGGDLRILMARDKDTRLMVVYGYARLVAYNANYEIVPDILQKVDVENGRVFTMHLRKGMRWSDGHPFTTDDFRYWWEDVANNKVLSRFGLPRELLVNGERPKVEFPDKYTVRYSWSKPNPYFLPALARASPLYIYMPKHYMKRFNAKYASKKWLRKVTKNGKRPNYWARYHRKRGRQYRFQNTKLPTLQPWINTTRTPAQRYVFVRNPYFYRVDTNGRQLPYINRVLMSIADSKIVPAKTGAGETDLQARYLRLSDYTFLRRAAKRNGYKVLQWREGYGSHIALYPNLNMSDPVWRKLLRDVRFRRALSLGIDRNEINKVMYYGIAYPGANTVLPSSPLFKPIYRKRWSSFDPAEANRLLDEIGLTKRDDDGYRLLPDGRPLEIIVEAPSEGTEYTDTMRLIKDSWKQIGVRLYPKSTRREMFRRRVYSGLTQVSMWSGLDFADLHANNAPLEFAPTEQVQLEWPMWGLWYATKHKSGDRPDTPAPEHLLKLLKAWEKAFGDRARQTEIWQKILNIWSEQVFTIGTVGGVIQPVVVNDRLRNVPVHGIYAWNPGAQFGIYRPDTFWFAKPSAQPAN